MRPLLHILFAILFVTTTNIRGSCGFVFNLKKVHYIPSTRKKSALLSTTSKRRALQVFQPKRFSITTHLKQSEKAVEENNDSKEVMPWSPINFPDIIKYVVATGLQFTVLSTVLKGIDMAVIKFMGANKTLPPVVVGFLFAFLSLRSRVASVLDNSRPNREAMKGKATPSDIKRPSWTPPGIAFPFIWLTITALRGISSAMIYSKVGQLCNPILLSMIVHLCIGDTWNTITNIEKRLGVSSVGVLVVWASVWNVIIQYYKIVPLAGKLIAPSGIWISIATILTISIWQLNKPIQPLWPVQGNGKSAKWKFQNLGQLEATTIRGGK